MIFTSSTSQLVDPLQQEREVRVVKTIDALHRKYAKGTISKAVLYI
ncbi:hypothetical protein [Staphylococcus americanisciuri]|uniref:Uncharacterized protein n=1 Tax=Staphylococcus americanisciuri TaxID=2973940 RepID=A0ABT2EYS0_9STAP|nr:hypothetical protein [Staphylococcus americanisciuri]MCS4485388.1 hypothetical protein [Staphylococcus americanisciuri]